MLGNRLGSGGSAAPEPSATPLCRQSRWPPGSLLKRAVAASMLTLLPVSCGSLPVIAQVGVVESRSADSVPRYGIFELVLRHNGHYENNFLDVAVAAVFTAPSGSHRNARGFYYTSDVWSVRFSPDEPGHWTYSYLVTGKGGFRQQGGGAFDCLPSDAEGSVRRNPDNPYGWVFENRTGSTPRPYFPIGLQDCVRVRDGRLAAMAVDGEERDGTARRVSTDEYFDLYGRAGFNLFRFSQRNCSYLLLDDLGQYLETEAMATDELLATARRHGFRVMFGLFGSYEIESQREASFLDVIKRFLGGWFEGGDQAGGSALTQQKHFVDYCIARWGVYVDFWELLNERHVSDEWTSLMGEYVRAVDPDQKPLSTSWEKPHVPAIDINAPHWYESERELDSDLRVRDEAAEWKNAGKPVIVGEQGNRGMNWDPLSATRMRIRTWTALFNEISFIFWNTSWSKAGMNHGRSAPAAVANIYLGPEERRYIRSLSDFTSRLDASVRMAPVTVSAPNSVRAYGLLSTHVAAAYLHHAEAHSTAVRGLTITLDVPVLADSTAGMVGEWIEPSTGASLASVSVRTSRPTLEVPPFSIDLAFVVTPDASHDRSCTTPGSTAVTVRMESF